MKDIKGLSVKKTENFSEWYSEVVQKAELADYAPVKGFMIIRPGAYSIWENIQENFNAALKKFNVRNCYFPLLIPNSFFEKEAEHAEGFAPELAYVSGTDDGEKLAIRPTSETIIYDSFSKWIRSWRDLPLKINQWCNILRWEVKQTKPFLRTREFLWQEGHCAYANESEAEEDRDKIILEYKKMVEELLAIPVLIGLKSKMETFPGAKSTKTIEALMPDGKALQLGTSHLLNQGFSKAFNMKYLGEDGKEHFVWTTSWGFSTRLIGALIMVHGDDKGFIIPPRIANNKIVIVPILFENSKEKVMKKANDIAKKLNKFGAFVDGREEYSPGWKFNEWEMRGVPLRIEIGPKDLEAGKVTIVRRDNSVKEQVSEKIAVKRVDEILNSIQRDLFRKAEIYLKSRINEGKSIEDLKKKLKEGNIVKIFMKDSSNIEKKLKELTAGAVSRIIEKSDKKGKCIISGESVENIGYIAKSY